jgi:sugar phosphate permease
LFYLCVLAAVISPIFFVRGISNEAHESNYRWISDSSRGMYVDVLKTAISVAGVAVTLVASSLREGRDSIVKLSVHIAVISLIVCIVASLVCMLALARGLEQARSRSENKGISNGKGELFDTELGWILIPAYFALATFLVGLLFLGRVAFHI